MTFDAFTFVAQIINFIILVLLLRHFLYKRIVKVMDEREQNIKNRIEEAEQKKEEAEEEKKNYSQKKQELDEKKEDMISRAQKEAEEKKKGLVEKARQDVEQTRKRWRESLNRQKKMFLDDLQRRTGEEVFAVARKVLRDLADEDLEKHIAETFLRRIRNLKDEEKERLKESLKEADQKAVILSRFKMPESFRRKAEKTVKEVLGKNTRLSFKSAEDLIGGVELEAGDRKTAWGIDIYLGELEEKMSEIFEQKFSEEKTEEGKEKEEEKGKKQEKKKEKNANKKKKSGATKKRSSG